MIITLKHRKIILITSWLNKIIKCFHKKITTKINSINDNKTSSECHFFKAFHVIWAPGHWWYSIQSFYHSESGKICGEFEKITIQAIMVIDEKTMHIIWSEIIAISRHSFWIISFRRVKQLCFSWSVFMRVKFLMSGSNCLLSTRSSSLTNSIDSNLSCFLLSFWINTISFTSFCLNFL